MDFNRVGTFGQYALALVRQKTGAAIRRRTTQRCWNTCRGLSDPPGVGNTRWMVYQAMQDDLASTQGDLHD